MTCSFSQSISYQVLSREAVPGLLSSKSQRFSGDRLSRLRVHEHREMNLQYDLCSAPHHSQNVVETVLCKLMTRYAQWSHRCHSTQRVYTHHRQSFQDIASLETPQAFKIGSSHLPDKYSQANRDPMSAGRQSATGLYHVDPHRTFLHSILSSCPISPVRSTHHPH